MFTGGGDSGSSTSTWRSQALGMVGDDTPVTIELNGGIDGYNVDISVHISSESDLSSINTRLIVAATMDSVSYSAPNGLQHHHGTIIEYLTVNNNSGDEIDLDGTNDVEVNYEWTMNSNWPNNSTVTWDISNLNIVAFVQDYNSKDVYQAEEVRANELIPSHVELTLIHQDDWNMVGLPLGVEDSYYLTLFPDAINNTLFSFGEGYSLETNFVEGAGYWLRFDSYDYNTIVGEGFEENMITLSEDWNMISGVTEPASVNAIFDPYGLIIPNTIYSFGEGYELADVIEPGLGYWIRSYGEGYVTISSNARRSKSKFVNRLTDANTISFNGKTLHFGIDIPKEEILSYSLPPKPPAGAFDVRYVGDWNVVKDGGDIEIMNNSIELKIDYEIHQNKWVLINLSTGEEHELTKSGTMEIIGDADRFSLMKMSGSIPEKYILAQNYPNPFNPVTAISYSIPTSGFVSLKVFDLLGEEVSTVIEGERKAGFHTAQFDGSHLSSGVYFYKLSSNDWTLTKKLILLK
mgnify:CR=1 FL=1